MEINQLFSMFTSNESYSLLCSLSLRIFVHSGLFLYIHPKKDAFFPTSLVTTNI